MNEDVRARARGEIQNTVDLLRAAADENYDDPSWADSLEAHEYILALLSAPEPETSAGEREALDAAWKRVSEAAWLMGGEEERHTPVDDDIALIAKALRAPSLSGEREALDRLAAYFWGHMAHPVTDAELREFRGLKDKVRRPYERAARDVLGLRPEGGESDE
jgi:hypothetical protein